MLFHLFSPSPNKVVVHEILRGEGEHFAQGQIAINSKMMGLAPEL